MVADGDDSLGTEPRGREDTAESDRTVADHHAGVARTDASADRGVVSCAHHVCQRQERPKRVLVVGVAVRHADEGAVGVGTPDHLALGTAVVAAPPVTVHTRGVKPLAAERTRPTRDFERREHPVAGLDRPDIVSDGFDDAHRFVADKRGDITVAVAAVEPQVGAADRGVGHPDDRVRWGFELRFGGVLDPDLTGTVVDCCAHTRRVDGTGKNPGIAACIVRVHCCSAHTRPKA